MAGSVHLRKFSQTCYKDSGASDTRQIPIEGANVNVYKQGATTSGSSTVLTTNTSVSVRSVGRLAANDTVQLGTDATQQMLVVSITDDTNIVLRSTIGQNIAVASGQRLVPYSDRPTLYSESLGIANISNPASTNAVGYVEFYTPETRFDVIVSGSGLTSTLYIDNEGGWIRGGSSWVNAKDYATVQAAIDALPSGVRGTVFVPAGTYALSGSLNLNFTNTHLLGEQGFTTFTQSNVNTNIINVNALGCSVKNITVSGPGSAGSGVGIYCNAAASAIAGTVIENCSIANTASWGIVIEPTAGFGCYLNKVINCDIDAAASGGSLKYGVSGTASNSLYCRSTHFHGPGFGTHGVAATRGGVHLIDASHCTFVHCYFEHASATTSFSTAGSCTAVSLYNCVVETTISAGDNQQFMFTNSGNLRAFVMDNCITSRNSTATGLRLFSSEATATVRASCISHLTGTDKHAAAQSDDIVLGAALDEMLLFNTQHFHVDTGAGRTLSITARDGVAMVIGQAPEYRIKLPGVTGHAAIVTPMEGDIIYDKTLGLIKYYDGATWQKLSFTAA